MKTITENNRNSTDVSEIAYVGNYVYSKHSSEPNPIFKLRYFGQQEGYVEPTEGSGFNYVYQYKDHLGNIRLTYSDNNYDNNITTDEFISETTTIPLDLSTKAITET